MEENPFQDFVTDLVAVLNVNIVHNTASSAHRSLLEVIAHPGEA